MIFEVYDVLVQNASKAEVKVDTIIAKVPAVGPAM